jgi:hypothetical protein
MNTFRHLMKAVVKIKFRLLTRRVEFLFIVSCLLATAVRETAHKLINGGKIR